MQLFRLTRPIPASACKRWANINVPPPVPTAPNGPPSHQPLEVPTPDGWAPQIDEPTPEPSLPIREPGLGRPPQAVHRRAGMVQPAAVAWLH